MTEPLHDPNAAMAAAKLDRRAFRQWLRARELELEGADAPGGLGRLWKPAKNERHLVLFSLAIIVLVLVIGTLVYAIREEMPNDAVVTSLTTLAGTGLGFIGGMVSKGSTSSDADKADSSTTVGNSDSG